MTPLIWLVAGILLVVAELLVGEFVLLMLGAAALLTAAASALGVPFGVDVGVFAVAAAALVGLARPALARRLRPGTAVTGTSALLGARAHVLETVDATTPHPTGTVRIGGAVWSARPAHDGVVIESGTPVVVVDIQGATAVVAGD